MCVRGQSRKDIYIKKKKKGRVRKKKKRCRGTPVAVVVGVVIVSVCCSPYKIFFFETPKQNKEVSSIFTSQKNKKSHTHTHKYERETLLPISEVTHMKQTGELWPTLVGSVLVTQPLVVQTDWTLYTQEVEI